MNKIIAITIGDIKGIGIEILLIVEQNKKNFILFTNIKVFQNYLNKRKLKFKLNKINNNLNRIIFQKIQLIYFHMKLNLMKTILINH